MAAVAAQGDLEAAAEGEDMEMAAAVAEAEEMAAVAAHGDLEAAAEGEDMEMAAAIAEAEAEEVAATTAQGDLEATTEAEAVATAATVEVVVEPLMQLIRKQRQNLRRKRSFKMRNNYASTENDRRYQFCWEE